MSDNPYATSASAMAVQSPMHDSAEAIRQYHIKHEASVKTVGFLYILGAIIAIIAVIGFAVPGTRRSDPYAVGVAALYGLMGVFSFFVGREICKLTSWARIVGIVFALIGLLGFPIGTLLNFYILWLFASKKGAYVFSPEYKQIIGETPHIKYRSKARLILLIVVLAILVVLGVIGWWTSRS